MLSYCVFIAHSDRAHLLVWLAVLDLNTPALLVRRDNTMTGYIYGNGIILSTHNAGATWMVESPNTMIIAQPQVVGLATVPTTY